MPLKITDWAKDISVLIQAVYLKKNHLMDGFVENFIPILFLFSFY